MRIKLKFDVRKFCMEHAVTFTELANQINVSYNTINNILDDEQITLRTYAKLKSAFPNADEYIK